MINYIFIGCCIVYIIRVIVVFIGARKCRKKQKQTHRYKQVVARDKENCVQKVQTFSYKISKSWGYNVQCGDYS